MRHGSRADTSAEVRPGGAAAQRGGAAAEGGSASTAPHRAPAGRAGAAPRPHLRALEGRGSGPAARQPNGAAAHRRRGARVARAAQSIIARSFASANGCGTAEIAARLGVASSTLCRAFRETYGYTVTEEIRRRRIALACRLIRDRPERLLKQIAAEVGFKHAAYRTFLNAFRQHTGVCPSDFRRAVLRGDRHGQQRDRQQERPLERRSAPARSGSR